MIVDRNGLEVLGRDECLQLLRTVPVGRLGLSIDALPVVVPVNFALNGHRVVVGTGEGSKLDAAVAGMVVAFEADWWDPFGHRGWSVLVQGPAEVIDSGEELEQVQRLPIRPWGTPRLLRYVGIPTDVVTGRRLRPGHAKPVTPAEPTTRLDTPCRATT